jgi:3-dehydroquinate synthase
MRICLNSIEILRTCLSAASYSRPQREVDLRKSLWVNKSVQDSLTVQLSAKSYPIHFVRNAEAAIGRMILEFSADHRRSALITDAGVVFAHAALIDRVFNGIPRLVLDAGEGTKSLENYGRALEFLAAERMDRRSVIWVLGGGVVGDLAGFAAASYQRGIDFVQVPTTLLAMVDSSVGGKTGINLAAGKNLVGAFHHPLAVFVATDFLATLPPREFAAGAAEVIKYGLLADAALFEQLSRAPLSPGDPALGAVVRRCCEIKAAIVREDERELARDGGRALLNLGHTFGHAIEAVAGYGAYLHGEAVAIGLCAAARLSHHLGRLAMKDVDRVESCVAAHGLPLRLRAGMPEPTLRNAMSHDKKNRGGNIRFVVLDSIGRAATRSDVPLDLVTAVWREVGAEPA